jgi:hypothetical protein
VTAYWVKDEHESDYQDWLNELFEAAPDHYDGDDSMESILTRYVRDLEAVRDAAVTVVEHLACNHFFDPDCGRCGWMLPLRCAMAAAQCSDPDELAAVQEHVAEVMFDTHDATPDCLLCQRGVDLGVWKHYGYPNGPWADNDSPETKP